MSEFKIGDEVMIMLGEDSPERGVIVAIKKDFAEVEIHLLWPPDMPPRRIWCDTITLLKVTE